jgi:ATP-dependent Clp protease ATP-binding subunit ClpA
VKSLTAVKARRQPAAPSLESLLESKLVGQAEAVRSIVPFVEMFRANLSPEGRPAGVFLLIGPTGTGKTRTVEALASALHGSEKNLLRIDCGEFQMEHEVAKLIGAPPGYLGHRETQPMLTQAKLNSVASEQCGLSILLLDEIEKAAPSLTRLLLGVLDKGVLRLGDNTTVNFERTIIFLTSNLGARAMRKAIEPDFGFAKGLNAPNAVKASRKLLESIGLHAVKRKFSPEFVNRIDSVVTYQPLDRAALERILDLLITGAQEHLDQRLGPRSFHLVIPPRTRRMLLEQGTSSEFGARELKRTIHRRIMQPLAAMVSRGEIPAGATVTIGSEANECRILVDGALAA